VAQREDLELEGDSRSEAGAERPEKGEKDRLHEERRLPHLGRTYPEFLAGQLSEKPREDSRFGILRTHRGLEKRSASGPTADHQKRENAFLAGTATTPKT